MSKEGHEAGQAADSSEWQEKHQDINIKLTLLLNDTLGGDSADVTVDATVAAGIGME